MNSYILFYSSNYTIWAESILNKADIKCKMESVPRELSSDCGYYLRINAKDKEKVKKLLNENNIPISNIVDMV